jgi:hypothetical protein
LQRKSLSSDFFLDDKELFDSTTYMSYSYMKKFKDCYNRIIFLSNESFEHIKSGHPEITINQIKNTLLDPLEIHESSKQMESLLYYSIKIRTEKKVRYICVVVKKTSKSELFVETAMTTSNIKKGRIVFKKEEIKK